MAVNIPTITLSSSFDHRRMPVIGMGTVSDQKDEHIMKQAILESIKVGYRHLDTASLYGSEKAVGDAIQEALKLGLISSREELFITSKLWCTESHPHLVIPSLQKSLSKLQLDYLDLYLVHFPVSAKPNGKYIAQIPDEELLPFDFKGVWKAMEDCQKLGLTKSIGVSNFSCKKLQTILDLATIPPSVNQVEMNPIWQQRKLVEFCKDKGIIVTAYCPLGAVGTTWGSNRVMENESLKQIAKAHGKTIAQVCLRWIIEQGATVVVKSHRKERMIENLGVFDWELNDDDHEMINQIPQYQLFRDLFVSPIGPYKTSQELWDEDI